MARAGTRTEAGVKRPVWSAALFFSSQVEYKRLGLSQSAYQVYANADKLPKLTLTWIAFMQICVSALVAQCCCLLCGYVFVFTPNDSF